MAWPSRADVVGGQVHAAAAQVTGHALDPAVTSFLQGFELALLLAGVILAVGGIVGFRGLRHLAMSREHQMTDVSASK